MKWRLLSIALVLGFIGVIFTPGQPQITETDQRPVAIATLACSNSLQVTSSGLVVDNGLVVTVAHAIFESRDFAIRDVDGHWHRGEVQHMDLARDLAVVRVPELTATRVELAAGRAGNAVELLNGAASGRLEGEIVRRVNIRTEVVGDLSSDSVRSGYEVEMDIVGGDSGAGIVDSDGDLVAIMFARSTSREGVSWATSATEVGTILRRSGVPEWECGPGTGAELVLEEADEPRLP